MGPEDVLLVVSDHGFRASPEGVPNVWVPRIAPALARAGLDPARDGFHVITRFGIVILQVHEGPFEERQATLERLAALLDGWRGPDGDSLFDVDVIDVAAPPPGRRRRSGRVRTGRSGAPPPE